MYLKHSERQLWSEFNANNFMEHRKIPLNKSAICGNRKQKGTQNKPQGISSIKSKQIFFFLLLSVKPGISLLWGKNIYHSIPTVSTSIFRITVSQ